MKQRKMRSHWILTDDDVRKIRRVAERREKLRRAITGRYGGSALARRFHASTSTIDRILCANYRRGRAEVIAPAVLALVERREKLRAWISREMSNDALARKFGTHENTILAVTTYAWHRHVR